MSQPGFIDALVADLDRVRPGMPWLRATLSWSLLSWALTGFAILAVGPLREGVFTELTQSPRLGLELALGLATSLTAIWAGLELGVPGASAARRLWTLPLVLFGAWALAIGSALIGPYLPTTSGGGRAHCFAQTLVISLPPYAVALYFLRGRIAYARIRTGLLVGTAAAAIPALWMHVACQAEPLHVLLFHLSPILIAGLFGAVLALRVLPRI